MISPELVQAAAQAIHNARASGLARGFLSPENGTMPGDAEHYANAVLNRLLEQAETDVHLGLADPTLVEWLKGIPS